MLPLLHFVGTLPLTVGFLAQTIVLAAALREKDKPVIIQSLVLFGALSLITVGALMRPKSPPNLTADIISCLGAIFLLAPGAQALLKLFGKNQG